MVQNTDSPKVTKCREDWVRGGHTSGRVQDKRRRTQIVQQSEWEISHFPGVKSEKQKKGFLISSIAP